MTEEVQQLVNLRELRDAFGTIAKVSVDTYLACLRDLTGRQDNYPDLGKDTGWQVALSAVALHRAGYLVVTGDSHAERWVVDSYLSLHRKTCTHTEGYRFWIECGQGLFTVPVDMLGGIVQKVAILCVREGLVLDRAEVIHALNAFISTEDSIKIADGAGIADRVLPPPPYRPRPRSILKSWEPLIAQETLQDIPLLQAVLEATTPLVGMKNQQLLYSNAKTVAMEFEHKFPLSRTVWESVVADLRRNSNTRLTEQVVLALGREASLYVYLAKYIADSSVEVFAQRRRSHLMLSCPSYFHMQQQMGTERVVTGGLVESTPNFLSDRSSCI